MQLPIYQFDAFTTRRFGGNPAAIVIANDNLSADQMQAIAAENNLSETAFVILGTQSHELRWFTPKAEVDLCGHATLAAAAALREHNHDNQAFLRFSTRSGELTAQFEEGVWALDFPALAVASIPTNSQLNEDLRVALGANIKSLSRSQGLIVELDSAATIQGLTPDIRLLATLEAAYICVTAPGDDCDFVSRVFAPRLGVDEDPVTGSAHCSLTPFWHGKTGKQQFVARQLSRRRGEIHCELSGERVILRGTAVPYLAGHIHV